MKNLLLILVICSFSFYSFSQETINKTDSKGLKQGKWVSKYPNGKVKYEGSFDQNLPVGEWKRYHENGKIKALMAYRPNSERVFASLYDEEGKLYAKGVFEGTQRDSTWNFYSGDQLVLTENYHQGKKEGKSTAFAQDGKVLSEKMLKNDLVDGLSVEYYPSGTKRNEIFWLAGKKHGPARFYGEDGVVTTEGNYSKDLSDGIWKIFDKNGKVKYQVTYEKGEMKNGSTLDSLKLKEFKQYDQMKGKIPEPKVSEEVPNVH